LLLDLISGPPLINPSRPRVFLVALTKVKIHKNSLGDWNITMEELFFSKHLSALICAQTFYHHRKGEDLTISQLCLVFDPSRRQGLYNLIAVDRLKL
jgi:hypothetical protein